MGKDAREGWYVMTEDRTCLLETQTWGPEVSMIDLVVRLVHGGVVWEIMRVETSPYSRIVDLVPESGPLSEIRPQGFLQASWKWKPFASWEFHSLLQARTPTDLHLLLFDENNRLVRSGLTRRMHLFGLLWSGEYKILAMHASTHPPTFMIKFSWKVAPDIFEC